MKHFLYSLIFIFVFFIADFANASVSIIPSTLSEGDKIVFDFDWSLDDYIGVRFFSSYYQPTIVTATTTINDILSYVQNNPFALSSAPNGYAKKATNWQFLGYNSSIQEMNFYPGYYNWGPPSNTNIPFLPYHVFAVFIKDFVISDSPADNYYILEYYVDYSGNISLSDTFINPTDWTNEYFSLSPETLKFYTPPTDVCFVNGECKITMYYNELAQGSTVYFLYDDGRSLFPNNSEFDFTISTSSVAEYQFSVDSLFEATTTPYCLFLDSINQETYLRCGMKIQWVATSSYEYVFADSTDPCDQVASSTGTFWDDMRYGVECGFKRIIKWSFVPSPTSMDKILDSKDKVMNSFPFSIITDVNDVVTVTSQSTSTMLTYGDFINLSEYDNDSYALLNTSQVSDTLGTVWTQKIYPFFQNLIWIFTFLYIIHRLSFFHLEKHQ